MIAMRVLRLLLVEGEAEGDMRLFLLVPLGKLMAILELDCRMLDHVLAAVLKELLIASDGKNFELSWVPLLRVDFFDLVLAWLEYVVVLGSAGLAEKDGMGQLEVSGLVFHAVDAVCIELILSNTLLQIILQLSRLLLWCVLWDRQSCWDLNNMSSSVLAWRFWLDLGSLRLSSVRSLGLCSGRRGTRLLVTNDEDRGLRRVIHHVRPHAYCERMTSLRRLLLREGRSLSRNWRSLCRLNHIKYYYIYPTRYFI